MFAAVPLAVGTGTIRVANTPAQSAPAGEKRRGGETKGKEKRAGKRHRPTDRRAGRGAGGQRVRKGGDGKVGQSGTRGRPVPPRSAVCVRWTRYPQAVHPTSSVTISHGRPSHITLTHRPVLCRRRQTLIFLQHRLAGPPGPQEATSTSGGEPASARGGWLGDWAGAGAAGALLSASRVAWRTASRYGPRRFRFTRL